MSRIPAGRREVRVRSNGNCFYRAMAIAVEGKSNESHLKLRTNFAQTWGL